MHRFLILWLAAFAPSLVRAAPPALPALAADATTVTVSGLSSGGYMAVQFQVAHSRNVRGAGVIAGGPYLCAQGAVTRALRHCMAPGEAAPVPTVAQTNAALEALHAGGGPGRIDAPSHLREHRVWLWSGGADHTVERPVMDALAAFYQSRLPAASIRYLTPLTAGHALPTAVDAAASECSRSEPPYLNRCRDADGGWVDGPGRLLEHLLPGPLTAPVDGVPMATVFDQRPYLTGKAVDASLADTGYVYVPAACRTGGCRIHVAFHGCQQHAEAVGTRFVDGAGYNRWADSKRLIVLYPQTVARYGLAFGSWRWLFNPKACWDWWGYTGADYATQAGVQIQAVRRMVERLAAPPTR